MKKEKLQEFTIQWEKFIPDEKQNWILTTEEQTVRISEKTLLNVAEKALAKFLYQIALDQEQDEMQKLVAEKFK